MAAIGEGQKQLRPPEMELEVQWQEHETRQQSDYRWSMPPRLFGTRRLEIVLPSILTMPARAIAGARKNNGKPQNKSLLKKKAGHFRKKSAPPRLSQIF